MLYLNPMDDIIFESIDYCELLMEYEVFINRENIENQLALLREEANNINTVKNTIDDILQKIIDFFKRIWEKFTGKVKDLTLKNTEWLNRYSKSIKNADFNNINLTILPYWVADNNYKNFISDLTLECRKTINDLTVAKKEKKNLYQKAKEVIQSLIDKLRSKLEDFNKDSTFVKKYQDKNANLSAGVANYLRLNDAKKDYKDSANYVKLTGNELSSTVDKMMSYCLAYEANVKQIENDKKKIDDEISTIEKELSERELSKESVSILQESIQLLFEDDNVTNDNQPKNGSVEVKNVNQNNNNATNNNNSDLSKLDSIILKGRNEILQRLQVGFAAVLSGEEEKYLRYMGCLRAIASKTSTNLDAEADKVSEKNNTDTSKLNDMARDNKRAKKQGK